MEPKYTVLGHFWEPSEPLFLKSVLEGHGIPAFVVGEYTGNITPNLALFSGKMQGGIVLQVHTENAQAARELLEEGAPEPDDEEPADGEN